MDRGMAPHPVSGGSSSYLCRCSGSSAALIAIKGVVRRDTARPTSDPVRVAAGAGSVGQADGFSPVTTVRPAAVSLQTSQSGLIGLANHGSAQPRLIQLRIVLGLIGCPSRSKIGSLPPG